MSVLDLVDEWARVSWLLTCCRLPGQHAYSCQHFLPNISILNIPAEPRSALMRDAVETLGGRLTLEVEDPCPGSHTLIRVGQIESPEAVEALGTYLVGLIAGVVAIDLRVSERYLGVGAEFAGQLQAEVERVVGSSNEISAGFRDTRRNPWIAECLGHLLLMIAGDEPGVCVPGRVWAATVPHDKVSKQGLDLVAVYDEGGLPALCIGESKASSAYAASHLNSAIRLFREVDSRHRDYEIRLTMINSLDAHIPPEVRDRVPAMFWRDRRLYMPVIGSSADSDFDPATNRPTTFGSLLVALDQRRCVSVSMQDFHDFFDRVADSMRAAIAGFLANAVE